MNNLKKLSEHNFWANKLLIEFLYTNAEKDNIVLELINHIIKSGRAWIERLQKKDWNKDLWVIETLEDLGSVLKNNEHEIKVFLEQDSEKRIAVTRKILPNCH